MSTSLTTSLGEISISERVSRYERTPFGKEMLKHFQFDPSYRNLNHGSFGASPRMVTERQRAYQDECELAPDRFIRYTYPKLLAESRAAVAKLLNVAVDTVVYVPNATAGINTVLRNLVWHKDGNDEILLFSTIYGACGKTVEYVCEASGDLVKPKSIELTYPSEDSEIIALFKHAVRSSRAERKFPRVAIFDTISSMPGLRMPFEELTALCREEGILSLIDGAHSIGQIPLDLSTLNPDFFVSNCHKWLFVPRGCAVLYVPVKHQHLMRSTLPTSHGFEPRIASLGRPSTLPVSSSDSAFVQNFEFVGTIDNANYLVVPDAIKWREDVCGGEKAIMDYNIKLAREGSKIVADILGTQIIDNQASTLTNCCLVNVPLPITASTNKISGTFTVNPEFGWTATKWMSSLLLDEYNTFIALMYFQNQWWARLGGQVYLDLEDFKWAGNILKEVCAKVSAQESFS